MALQSSQGVFRTQPGSGNLNFADTVTLPSNYASAYSPGYTLIDQVPLAPNLIQKWSLLSVSVNAYLGLLQQGSQYYGRLGKLIAGLVLRGQPTSGPMTPILALPPDASLSGVLFNAESDPLPPSQTLLPSQSNTAANAGTGASSGAGTAWTNPNNITINGSAATVTLPSLTVAQYLVATNFGYAIPAGAVINGLSVTFQANAVGAPGNVITNNVYVVKAGVVQTAAGLPSVGSGVWQPSKSAQTYGSAISLGGVSLTPADVNNAGFGIAVQVVNDDLHNSSNLSLYGFVTLTVYWSYTIPIASLLPVSATVALPSAYKLIAGQQPCIGMWLTPSLLGSPAALTQGGLIVCGSTYSVDYDDGT